MVVVEGGGGQKTFQVRVENNLSRLFKNNNDRKTSYWERQWDWQTSGGGVSAVGAEEGGSTSG